MKLVLDTNVLIAAFISRGACHELLEHCVLHHQVVLSSFILDELKAGLTGKFKFSAREASAAVGLLKSRCEVVAASPLDTPLCRDPDDDFVVATAMAGGCACIVTGDKDLLELDRTSGLCMLSPGDFWSFEEASSRPG